MYFGSIFFGQYNNDAAASAPAPPAVVVVDDAASPTTGPPSGAGRWIHLPPTYVPIGIEYEAVIIDSVVIVATDFDVVAEGEVVREVVVDADVDLLQVIARASGSVSASVVASMVAEIASANGRASAVVVPTITCTADVDAHPLMYIDDDVHVEWTTTHVRLEQARQRIEEQALVMDFD